LDSEIDQLVVEVSPPPSFARVVDRQVGQKAAGSDDERADYSSPELTPDDLDVNRKDKERQKGITSGQEDEEEAPVMKPVRAHEETSCNASPEHGVSKAIEHQSDGQCGDEPNQHA